MTPLYIALGIAAWAACGWLAYRSTLSYFQREWRRIAASEYSGDVFYARLVSIAGPFGLFVAARSGGFRHGIAYVPPPGQRDEATF